ncbi:hypothetical protein [Kineosporia sp. A_224]|uniref:hypothetical protein n=1 Tax=Kineosporia sp. A_224 TaxID=1962180 RepID=UPI001179BFF7|nr:hypothetical protein [Kineosporia sp. A_224]
MRRSLPVVLLAVAVALVAGCTGGSHADVPAPTKSVAAAAGAVVLSKADGWRPALAGAAEAPSYYAVVEIAYDEASARTAWAQNAPTGPLLSGSPVEEGLYGRFEDVDLARQRIVVVSTGQSGSCPGWVTGVAVRPGGTVELTLGTDGPAGQTCSADFNAYRTVLAVDRDRLPTATDLTPPPTVLVDGSEVGGDVRVVAYPFDPAG